MEEQVGRGSWPGVQHWAELDAELQSSTSFNDFFLLLPHHAKISRPIHSTYSQRQIT
jgi:hypothetical protein